MAFSVTSVAEECMLSSSTGLDPKFLIQTPAELWKPVVESPCNSAFIPDGAALSAYQYFENMRNFLVAVQEMGLLPLKHLIWKKCLLG
ncbi:unnamed protein product [Ilex paraguariensis]|uniref:Uncharacterized protein n=1 Tax=Ilex paraguariensis TaxID=185542 RepID=A0ABC8QYZ5_9AQUA